MKEVKFKIKTITPTLMGGGFGQNDGIRPSEIKGIMRYWFRAVAGSVIGDNLEALKKLENQIFGSQERKSPFRIIIYNFDKKSILENLNWNNLPSHVKYLGFVINLNKERLNNVVRENSTFNVRFLFRNSIQEKTIKLIAHSFYLATALGGFGLRARRGFGSWQIEDVKVKNISLNLDSLKIYENREHIKNKIEEIKNLIKEILDIREENRNQEFKTINEEFIHIYTLNENSWENALEKLGEEYRKYRREQYSTPEYLSIKNYLSNGCRWSEIRKNNWNFAFGLPIGLNSRKSIKREIFNKEDCTKEKLKKDKSLGKKCFTKIGSFKVKHGDNYLERLPSTVWFSIKNLENNYYVILTYLEGKIFPDEKIDEVSNKKYDEVFFVFSGNLINYLKSQKICDNPPEKVKVEYNAEDLKDKAKNFVIRGLNNG